MADQSSSISLLYCPITRQPFRDPVIGGDGHTYEREAITEWLHSHDTSPLTREPMSASSLRPSFIVKNLLEFEVQIKKKNYKFKLNVDVRKKRTRPLFQAHGKFIYEAEWLTNSNAPDVVILHLNGTRALKEADFYVKLTNHPNIVRTFGIVESDIADLNSVMLLQECAIHGDLAELLRQQTTLPTEQVFTEIFSQISDGMTFLTRMHIVHGDLACRNILVFNYHQSDRNRILVKLTDFGLTRGSVLYQATSVANTATLDIVPFRAAAPEILRSNHRESYTEKSDMYSMGVLMWETLSKGQVPWSYIPDMQQVCSKVLSGERLPQPLSCSSRLWTIIMTCMVDHPANRPTFEQLKSSLSVLYPRLRHSLESTQNSTTSNRRQAPTRVAEQTAEATKVPCQFCNRYFPRREVREHQNNCFINRNQHNQSELDKPRDRHSSSYERNRTNQKDCEGESSVHRKQSERQTLRESESHESDLFNQFLNMDFEEEKKSQHNRSGSNGHVQRKQQKTSIKIDTNDSLFSDFLNFN